MNLRVESNADVNLSAYSLTFFSWKAEISLGPLSPNTRLPVYSSCCINQLE